MEKLLLSKLPYGYGELKPVISEGQLRLHYEKHNRGYVDSANKILVSLNRAKKAASKVDESIWERLVFNVAGNSLHSIYWQTMAPAGSGGEGPGGNFADSIDKDFGGLKAFKDQFSRVALGIEGSGWAALSYEPKLDRLLMTKIKVHQDGIYPTLPLVMVLDVWEHAYYLDYQNRRKEYVENFWKIVDWDGISQRFMTCG